MPTKKKDIPKDVKEDASNVVAVARSDWTRWLRLAEKTGLPKVSDVTNIEVILQNDPTVKGTLAYNEFSDMVELIRPLANYPIKPGAAPEEIAIAMQSVISRTQSVTFKGEILNNGILTEARRHKFNPIIDRLQKGADLWKQAGSPPLVDRLFIDYLGAEDTALNRQKTRMAVAGLIARALHPGIKFDFMTILVGPQGYGKTTLLRILAGDMYADGLTRLDDKDNLMIAMQAWLVNDDELVLLSHSHFANIKRWITQTVDYIRYPYGRSITKKPRHAVLFGTTNNRDILKDATGSRRFIIMECNEHEPAKHVLSRGDDPGFTEQDALMVLGEAYSNYLTRPKEWRPLYWNDAENVAMKDDNAAFVPDDPVADQIKQYLDMLLPKNWNSLSWEERQRFVHTAFNEGQQQGYKGTERRDTVSTASIMTNVFRYQRTDAGTAKYRELASKVRIIMNNMPGWKYRGSIRVDGDVTAGWQRV